MKLALLACTKTANGLECLEICKPGTYRQLLDDNDDVLTYYRQTGAFVHRPDALSRSTIHRFPFPPQKALNLPPDTYTVQHQQSYQGCQIAETAEVGNCEITIHRF